MDEHIKATKRSARGGFLGSGQDKVWIRFVIIGSIPILRESHSTIEVDTTSNI